ncbi:MAG: translocation/assembly module TamB [Bacteroidales bacterium]|nr:translocation/assembly module TamB [Bacteroidales bacterium]
MNKIAKKTVKILGRIGLGLLGVFILLLFAISSPLLQTQVVNRFLAQQSEKLGISARVQRVNIDFFSRQVKVSGIIIYDHHQNLLFDAGSVQTSLRDFSAQHLNLGATYIYDVVFRLHRYEQDSVSNLQLILDALGASEEDTTTSDFAFRTSAVFLRNMEFSFVDEVYSQGDTFQFIDFKNLSLSNINLTARNLHIQGDNILATIENLSLKEQSGFEIWRFSSRANVSPRGIIARNTDITTSNSDLDLDIRFTTESWDDYQDFLSNVRIYVNIRNSYLDFKDLIHFAPGLQGKQNQFHISGRILGTVDNFRAHNFTVSYGRNTKFYGDILMEGLPDFDDTFLDFSIQNLTTSPEDVDGFLLPNFGKIIVPDELHNLGLSSLSGQITGFPSDLRATIDLTTEAGHIQTSFRFFHDTLKENFDFSGQIEDANLALGVLLNNDAFGNNLDLNGSFDGKFSVENGIDFSTNLVLENIEYQNRQINTISIKGDWIRYHIATVVSITDDHGTAGFSGELSLDPENPYLEISGSFNDVDLAEFVFLNDTTPALLSFDFSGKLYSLNIDSLIGNFNFSDLSLAVNDTVFRTNNLSISQQVLPQGISTKVNCDYFSLDVFGNHKLSNLDAIWNNIQRNYLSALRLAVEDVELLTSREILVRHTVENGVHAVAQTLDLTLNIHKTGGFLSYFLPEIDLPRGANLRLKYDGEHQPLSLIVRANHATIYGFYASLLDIRGQVRDSVFQVNVDARNLHINNSRYFDDFSLVAGFENDFISWELGWIGSSNGDGQINGNLGGRMAALENNSISFNIQSSELLLGGQAWQFDPDNSIFIDSVGVRFENIRFYNQSDTLEYLSLNGDLSREPNSVLELRFERYQLSPWAPMIERIGLDFDGAISGGISIFDFYTTLRLNTDLKIEDFSINGFNYGTAFLRMIAEEGAARSFINLSVQDDENVYLSANGDFYSVGEERRLDLSIFASDMDLSLLKNYVETFSSSLTGKFSGELTLDGLLKSPNFYGDLTLDDAVMKIDFLNTYYAIRPEKIVFSLDSILFVNTSLEDITNQTQATLSGGLYHNRFDNFRLDINIETNNFLALNTTRSDNEDFFGRVFLTGHVNLSGPVENILIDVQGRTERGTELQINYSSRVNISEANQFIHFVVPKKNVDEEDFLPITNRTTADLDVPTNIMVRLNIDVTPDASVFFDMEAPPISGLIHAQGSGNLRMNFDSRTQEFTLFGDYVLQDGFYDFMFEDPALGLGRLITRRFYIERGGTLQWTGDPGNMILDVSAIYSTRASLAPVFANQLSTSGNTMRRVGVQSVISLVGRMSQPDIRFDFRLPAVDENTRTEFFTAINRDDENEMMRQTFFLLLFGGFTTPGDNLASAENISGEAMVWNALLNQANNMLNFGNNINLSASYRPEDIHSTEQWQVSMGAQFLDNRLLIEGHVGQGGLAHHLTEHSSQTIMELNVEYRLTDRLSLRGFNRPNERDFARRAQMGYSQGVGVAYRREFGSFRSLFNRRREDD